MQPTFGQGGGRKPVEILVAYNEDTGAIKLSVIDKSVAAEIAIPAIKRAANALGIVLADDDAIFKGFGEPERHLHLHEERSRVNYKQRA